MKGITLAVLAAVVWGIEYAVADQLLKKFSAVQFTILTSALSLGLSILFGMILKDEQPLFSLPKELSTRDHGLMLLYIVADVITTFLIVFAIKQSNATVASMVEISYPLFVALFSWLLFKENTINSWTIVGFTFVLLGVGVIFHTSR